MTLLAFSYNVLAGLELIRGGPVPEEEERAYLHLWRWVGRLLGLRDELNPCRAGMPLAKATLESIVLHLLHPDALSVRVAHHLLRAPRSSDAAFERSASMTRLLVGDELGDALELPWSLPGRRRARWALLRRCGTQAPVLFRQALERTRTPSAMSTVLVPVYSRDEHKCCVRGAGPPRVARLRRSLLLDPLRRPALLAPPLADARRPAGRGRRDLRRPATGAAVRVALRRRRRQQQREPLYLCLGRRGEPGAARVQHRAGVGAVVACETRIRVCPSLSCVCLCQACVPLGFRGGLGGLVGVRAAAPAVVRVRHAQR